eukprot:TRINITY_DN3299_c3_g1_i10.p1 TRINITY_DN3299_c3_g1~~TRINITY_DN3299_c3_g1_i10.p1  ORF type:complete len:86 (+),score=14.44 TRINITY_DN3299_c3_g1_i10:3-260(+)
MSIASLHEQICKNKLEECLLLNIRINIIVTNFHNCATFSQSLNQYQKLNSLHQFEKGNLKKELINIVKSSPQTSQSIIKFHFANN